MSIRIRKEEYSSLGDFIKISFVRDQDAIVARYPKLNETFLNLYSAKLEAIKVLESGLVLTEAQKSATASLYAEAYELNVELNFLKSYFKEAAFNYDIIEELKRDLSRLDIEGAILKIESLNQFVGLNEIALIGEGMSADFVQNLNAHKQSLSLKNASQNSFMNASKTLTDANKKEYKELYTLITKIANVGKLVFDKSIVKDEYVVSKVLLRMRAPKKDKVQE